MTLLLGSSTRSCFFLQQPQLFLHNSQLSEGPAWHHMLQNQSKESQIQLRLESSLNTPFLHVVQWNLIQVMVSAGCSKTHSLIWDDTEGSPLFWSRATSSLLAYFHATPQPKVCKKHKEEEKQQWNKQFMSWEVRNKRVVKINENKFSKNISRVFHYRFFCRLLTLFSTLSIIFGFFYLPVV